MLSDVLHRCFPYRCFAPRFVYSFIELFDPASGHMHVPKIKPCMSQYKPFTSKHCEWLIKTVIVLLMSLIIMDTLGNSRTNTRILYRLTKGGVCKIPNLPTSVVLLMIHDKLLIASGKESFKLLTCQLSMVGYRPTMAVTGN